jgi:hypothetical protein
MITESRIDGITVSEENLDEAIGRLLAVMKAPAEMDVTELRRALVIAARVLRRGDETHPPGASNHQERLPVREQVRHALVHLERHICGAQSVEDEVVQALIRLLLAVERRERLH